MKENKDRNKIRVHFDALEFGMAIRAKRKERGMDLDSAAEEIGTQHSCMSRTERGLKPYIGPAKLLRYCLWADLDPFDYLHDGDKPDGRGFALNRKVVNDENKK